MNIKIPNKRHYNVGIAGKISIALVEGGLTILKILYLEENLVKEFWKLITGDVN